SSGGSHAGTTGPTDDQPVHEGRPAHGAGGGRLPADRAPGRPPGTALGVAADDRAAAAVLTRPSPFTRPKYRPAGTPLLVRASGYEDDLAYPLGRREGAGVLLPPCPSRLFEASDSSKGPLDRADACTYNDRGSPGVARSWLTRRTAPLSTPSPAPASPCACGCSTGSSPTCTMTPCARSA